MELPVVFDSKGQQIVGMLHLPKGRGRFPAALFLHGFAGTKTEAHRIFVKMARALADHGIASLRFDYRGAGDSAGNFEELTMRSKIADALEAGRYLARHRRIHSGRLALIGFSTGAAVGAYVVGRERRRFQSLALWAPVADGAGILDELSTPDAVQALAETGVTDHRGNLVGVGFIRQFAEMKPVREIVKTKCPVLLVHGSRDDTVPVTQADLYERALLQHKRPVKKVVIAGADHAFSRHLWEQRVIRETLHWMLETV